jgi:hypothetical protein
MEGSSGGALLSKREAPSSNPSTEKQIVFFKYSNQAEHGSTLIIPAI